MDDNTIRQLTDLLKSTGFVNISCQRNVDPPIVQIDLPAGLGVSLPLSVYEQIRDEAGLPEGVCD